MIRYILSRLLWAVPTLLAIVVISFLLMKFAPGGPFDSDRRLPPDVKANIEEAYDLADPIHVQLATYVGRLLQGDMGPSFYYRDLSVSELIADAFPVTFKVGMSALLVAVSFGVLIGVIAALWRNSPTDYALMTVAMIGLTVPTFVMAPVMVLLFAIHLGWFPAGGIGEGGSLNNLVLPVLALALPKIAYISRLTRGSMIETLSSDFVRTAKAFDLKPLTVTVRHVLKPALMPVVSYLGPSVAATLTGTVVIEQVFGIPGLGSLFIQAALNRDYSLVMGVVVFYGTLIIAANLIVDLLYGLLDPRLRKG